MSKQNKKKTTKKEVHQPDDRFFRKVMSEKENVQAHLKTFYPEIAAIADLTTLKQETDEFIQPTLKIFRSDIIYRCRLKHQAEHFYFSLIWEHKLEPEENVAIQVGLYIFEFLYKLSKGKDRKIEPIIPLIFYNGKEKWQPKSVHELFQNHPNFYFFKRFLPDFDFLFKNITEEPIEKLLAIELAFLRSAMVAMSHRFKAETLIKQEYSIIFELTDKDQLYTFMTYFSAIAERSPKELKEKLENITFTTKPEVMSTLAMLRAEGRAEGKLEGEIKATALLSLKSLLNAIINFPQFNAKQIALFATFKEEEINQFLVLLQSKDIKIIKGFIDTNFLKNIELTKTEQQEINKSLKVLMKKRGKK